MSVEMNSFQSERQSVWEVSAIYYEGQGVGDVMFLDSLTIRVDVRAQLCEYRLGDDNF